MVYVDPPDDVAALRDMLVACDDSVAAGAIHYPEAAFAPQAGTADDLPAYVIRRIDYSRDSYASGGVSLPGGQLQVELAYPADTYTIGDVDEVADSLAADLLEQATGLPIVSVGVDHASSQTAAMDAEGTASAIFATITIDWGLT
jgi:hypothetical protein